MDLITVELDSSTHTAQMSVEVKVKSTKVSYRQTQRTNQTNMMHTLDMLASLLSQLLLLYVPAC